MDDIREQAFRYRIDVAHIGTAQYIEADRARRVHTRLGAPSAVLSTIVGTAIFATVERQPGVGYRVVAGLLALTAAVLAALPTHLLGIRRTGGTASHSRRPIWRSSTPV